MVTKKTVLTSITLIIFIAFFYSCTNDSGNPSSYSPFDEMPVVTGLFFTSEVSPQVIAVWGNPSGRSMCSPSIGDYTQISYSVPEQTSVKVWVVPARLPQQNSVDILNWLNAHFKIQKGIPVFVLINDVVYPGMHSVTYHFIDSNGGSLPEGFYRIYVDNGKWIYWCDVLNFRNESNYYKAIVTQIYSHLTYVGRP